eukprot:10126552-Prorocentrum_lima.AAC.1
MCIRDSPPVVLQQQPPIQIQAAIRQQVSLDRHEQNVYLQPCFLPKGLDSRVLRVGRAVPH